MTKEDIGIALRYGVFSPSDTAKTAKLVDSLADTCRIFVPDGRIGFESLETVSAILELTHKVRAGSGVIRLLEHDPSLLARRLQTIQAFSEGRCFLGVGTGMPGSQPANAIRSMLEEIKTLKASFSKYPTGIVAPEIWVAALRLEIARQAMVEANGLVLNFCSPEHTSTMSKRLAKERPAELLLGCYLKLFYSSVDDETAKRLLVQEFLNYDSIPHYHQMFAQDQTAQSIAHFREQNGWRTEKFELPQQLTRVSLANPKENDLLNYVKSFREAGVDLPIIYPYFPDGEKQSFKLDTITAICKKL